MDRNAKNLAFSNTRTTFQRTSDARFFNGRVSGKDDKIITIITRSDSRFKDADTFAFHVFCKGFEAFFYGVFTGRSEFVEEEETSEADVSRLPSECEFTFLLVSEVALRASNIEARYYPKGMTANVELSDLHNATKARVIDISDNGFSITCDAHFRKSDIVNVVVFGFGTEIPATAEVRYCVRDKSRPGNNRIGLKFKSFERVAESRWRQVLTNVVDQSRISEPPLQSDECQRLKPMIAS